MDRLTVAAQTGFAPASLLRRGDRGARVLALREQLSTVMGRTGAPAAAGFDARFDAEFNAGFNAGLDDEFDADLEALVRAFQQRRGLIADGIVGPSTARALDAARWSLGDRILLHTPGHLMRGDDVAALQERLVVLGLLVGPVDGVFGANTESALKDLQRGLGLEPDGLAGPETLQALGALRRAVAGGDPWALREQADVDHAGRSLAGKVVVLDPAHGGGDRGVVAHGVSEADVVLDIARRAQGRLAAGGVTAVLTRSADGCPDEAARAELARSVGADVVVSLHCDGLATPEASGVATFYWGVGRVGARSAVGERLATLLQREIVARTGLVDLQTHACTYDLLRLTRMPAVRVELGYLTNALDAAALADADLRDAVAQALVVAVQRLYLPADEDAATGTMDLRDILAHAGLG